MTLEKIQEVYPVGKTYIGYYECLQDFNRNEVTILREPETNYESITFFREIDSTTSEYWVYYYAPVLGYLTLDGTNFILMTYNEDMGWEEHNPEIVDDSYTIIVDGERVLSAESVMESFDIEGYDEGQVYEGTK